MPEELPFHTLFYDEILNRLRSFTNLRVVLLFGFGIAEAWCLMFHELAHADHAFFKRVLVFDHGQRARGGQVLQHGERLGRGAVGPWVSAAMEQQRKPSIRRNHTLCSFLPGHGPSVGLADCIVNPDVFALLNPRSSGDTIRNSCTPGCEFRSCPQNQQAPLPVGTTDAQPASWPEIGLPGVPVTKRLLSQLHDEDVGSARAGQSAAAEVRRLPEGARDDRVAAGVCRYRAATVSGRSAESLRPEV
jgi:hypothetical protein